MGTLKNKMKLFALLAVAAVQARQVNIFPEGDLNDACTSEGKCKDENAECKEPAPTFRDDADKKCLCKDTHVADTNEVCQLKSPELGGVCDDGVDDLKCGENQKCDNNKCVCADDFQEKDGACVPKGDDGEPTPPGLGGECNDETLNCTGDNQQCGSGDPKVCECIVDHVPNADKTECVKLTPLDEQCNGDTPCTGANQKCGDDEKCVCADDFKDDGQGTCVSASSGMKYSLGAAFLALILA